MTPTTASVSRRTRLVVCLAIGMLAGFLSGMFGVGGGTVIVPLLVLLLSFDQRLAAGTSLLAIVPTSIVGVVSYWMHGTVAWIPAAILAAAAVVGAQIGTWLLPRVAQTVLRWFFVGFLVAVVVSLFVVIPTRGGVFELSPLAIIGLAVTGLLTGVVSGLIGVGGGIVVVPVLIVLFGMSDLLARGTSLLMMVPTAISGTVGNVRRRNVAVATGLTIGAAACCTTAVGAWVATLVDPFVGNVLFACYLVFIATQMAIKAVRGRVRA